MNEMRNTLLTLVSEMNDY